MCLLWCATASLTAQEEEPIDAAGSDWVVALSTKKLRGYLSYPGSSLQPVSAVHVSYSQRDPKTTLWKSAIAYEDLWFHNGTAIGCCRQRNLPAMQNQVGVIKILPSADAPYETRSLIDSAMRVLLDVTLKNGAARTLSIPLEIYNQCASELGAFYFYEAQAGSAKDEMVLIHVVSSPAKIDKYFRLRTKPAPE